LADPVFSPDVPATTQTGLFWLGVAFFILLLAAVVLEYVRRWLHRRREAQEAWRLVEEMVQEKGLDAEETAGLRRLIERRAPGAPWQAATDPWRFERCVEEEMNALSAKGNVRQFQETGVLLRRVRRRLDLWRLPRGQGIRSTRDLPGGQDIWVSATASNAPQWHAAAVADVDEAYLHLSPSKENKERLPQFSVGDEVRCQMCRDNDAQYAFTTVVAACESDPPAWRLFHATELDRSQSRAYYRVRYTDRAALAVLAPAEGMEDHPPVVRPLRGTFHDLSAGGFSAVVDEAPADNALLAARLEFPEETPLLVRARAIDTRPLSGGRHLLRAEFSDLDEEVRDVIARFVLHLQQPMVAAPRQPAPEEAE